MRKLRRLCFGICLAMFLFRVSASAWQPDGWVFHTWPYAFALNESAWYGYDATRDMWCYNCEENTWTSLGALSSTWIFYQWPYGYVLEEGAWHWFNGDNTLPCFHLTRQWWSLFGTPRDMVLIPGGSNSGFNPLATTEDHDPDYYPATYDLNLKSFYMDRFEVTKARWDEVATWASNNGYDIGPDDAHAKGPNHPVYYVSWYEAAKWCNARSEMEGRRPAYYTDSEKTCHYHVGMVNVSGDSVDWTSGYRLPTQKQWEYAARGGIASKRYPWGSNTISHNEANYYATAATDYDLSSGGCPPQYVTSDWPFTSPVGSFEAGKNAYGLYDMAGNISEWCWNWHPANYDTQQRIHCGGSWFWGAPSGRIGYRGTQYPHSEFYQIGFRTVLPANE